MHIDAHHTVEDIGITLGQALNQALGDKKGLRRYGHAYIPLDEALSRVVLDISGRPGLVFNCEFVRGNVGEFDVDLIKEFFQGFVNHALVTLHIDNLSGNNAHHQAETIFQGIWPCAAHGTGAGSAHGRRDAFHQGNAVGISENSNGRCSSG